MPYQTLTMRIPKYLQKEVDALYRLTQEDKIPLHRYSKLPEYWKDRPIIYVSKLRKSLAGFISQYITKVEGLARGMQHDAR